jgi:hypothetical protein
MAYGASVGVMLDAPYLGEVRAADLYRVEDYSISNSVREWAVAHGNDPRMRIALCGYADEHEGKIPASWRVHAYSANAAYQGADSSKTTGNAANRHKERIWFSPHCFGAATLFA